MQYRCVGHNDDEDDNDDDDVDDDDDDDGDGLVECQIQFNNAHSHCIKLRRIVEFKE